MSIEKKFEVKIINPYSLHLRNFILSTLYNTNHYIVYHCYQ